jgi:DNA mismatch endonuclease, patch repair protein
MTRYYTDVGDWTQNRNMSEKFTKAERSRIMAAVKSRDTTPELIVRRLVHRLGYRFRLNRRDLPGTPDIVFPALRKIINVHGCFWHLHSCKHGRIAPVRNAGYWAAKRAGNLQRDRNVGRQLRRMGWSVLTLWECEIRHVERLEGRIATFLRR